MEKHGWVALQGREDERRPITVRWFLGLIVMWVVTFIVYIWIAGEYVYGKFAGERKCPKCYMRVGACACPEDIAKRRFFEQWY